MGKISYKSSKWLLRKWQTTFGDTFFCRTLYSVGLYVYVRVSSLYVHSSQRIRLPRNIAMNHAVAICAHCAKNFAVRDSNEIDWRRWNWNQVMRCGFVNMRWSKPSRRRRQCRRRSIWRGAQYRIMLPYNCYTRQTEVYGFLLNELSV